MSRRPHLSELQLAAQCRRFNARHPVGSIIRVWTGLRLDGEPKPVVINQPGARVLSGHTAVVQIRGGGGSVALTHVADEREAHMWCWRTGAIDIAVLLGKALPPAGAIVLATGTAWRLELLAIGSARLAYDGETLLVPGVPEAVDDDAALEATERYRDRLLASMLAAAPGEAIA